MQSENDAVFTRVLKIELNLFSNALILLFDLSTESKLPVKFYCPTTVLMVVTFVHNC